MKKRKTRRRNRFGPPTPFFSKSVKRWIVRYRQGGRSRERKFREHHESLEFATQVWQDQQDGINSRDMTLEQLVRRFLATKSDHSGSTQSDYRRTLEQARPLFDVPIGMIRPLALDDLIGSLDSSAARQRLRGKLSMLFRQAMKWELIRRNPVESTKKQSHKPEKAETFTLVEVTSILQAASEHRLVGMFDLGFTLGPRPEELFGFQWQDWREEEQELLVRRKVAEVGAKLEIGPPKTAASVRALTLPDHIHERLIDRRKAALKEGRASQKDWIWPNIRGKPIRRSNLRNHIWTRLLKQADVPYRKLYCMRHTAASRMLNGCNDIRGVALAVVSETLGHDNPQITLEVYSHVLKTDRDEVRKFWNRAIGAANSGG